MFNGRTDAAGLQRIDEGSAEDAGSRRARVQGIVLHGYGRERFARVDIGRR